MHCTVTIVNGALHRYTLAGAVTLYYPRFLTQARSTPVLNEVVCCRDICAGSASMTNATQIGTKTFNSCSIND
jgi:hypothetical protein